MHRNKLAKKAENLDTENCKKLLKILKKAPINGNLSLLHELEDLKSFNYV